MLLRGLRMQPARGVSQLMRQCVGRNRQPRCSGNSAHGRGRGGSRWGSRRGLEAANRDIDSDETGARRRGADCRRRPLVSGLDGKTIGPKVDSPCRGLSHRRIGVPCRSAWLASEVECHVHSTTPGAPPRATLDRLKYKGPSRAHTAYAGHGGNFALGRLSSPRTRSARTSASRRSRRPSGPSRRRIRLSSSPRSR